MSGRADIIALARTLGLASTDAVLLDRYYTELLVEFGMATEILLEPRLIPVVASQALYLVADTNHISAAFFGTRELTKTTLQHLTTFDPEYRTREGTPRVWAEEHENHNVVRLYPIPAASSVPAVLAPAPFGANYPPDYLAVFAADSDETAAPWLDFVLALGILARDLTHQSSYRDPVTAEACVTLGQAARTLGGSP